MPPQTILITGATAGIGRFVALDLAARGHHVIACGRRTEALASLKAEARGRVDGVRMDVTDPASIEAAHAEVDRLTEGRGVDVLINNAGYGQLGATLDVSDADVHHQFDTTVHGLLRVTRAFAGPMIRRRAGRILNVSSIGGRLTMPLGGVYHASKYAVEALSDALRMELRPFGVDVIVIEPGAIRTEFGTVAVHELHPPADSPWGAVYPGAKKLMADYDAWSPDPSSVARAVEHAVESRWPRTRYVAPFYNHLLLFFMAHAPARLTDRLMRAVFGLEQLWPR